MNILNLLRCPLCGGVMRKEGGSLHCEAGHCLDIAKEGYVNLLPPGKGKNAKTGDEKEMLRARGAFLSGGYYASISNAIGSLLHRYLPVGEAVLCDSGCGEGWHTLQFTLALADKDRDRQILTMGFDASKYGAASGMKTARHRMLEDSQEIGGVLGEEKPVQVFFFPGNLFHLPVADNTVSGVVSMFAPIAAAENHRLLREDGILVVASSGKEHLREMRELLYEDVNYTEKTPDVDGFTLIHHETVRYTADLPDQKTIFQLFTMTPFYYRTNAAGRERLMSLDSLSVTVETELWVFRKTDNTIPIREDCAV